MIGQETESTSTPAIDLYFWQKSEYCAITMFAVLHLFLFWCIRGPGDAMGPSKLEAAL